MSKESDGLRGSDVEEFEEDDMKVEELAGQSKVSQISSEEVATELPRKRSGKMALTWRSWLDQDR